MRNEYEVRKEAAIIVRDIISACSAPSYDIVGNYCEDAVSKIKKLTSEYIDLLKSYDDLTQKAAETANKLKELEVWLGYIDIALGESKKDIYAIAAAEKAAVDRYKERLNNIAIEKE